MFTRSIVAASILLLACLSPALAAPGTPPVSVDSWHPANWDTVLPPGISAVRTDGRRIVPDQDPTKPDYCPGLADRAVTQAQLDSPAFITDSRNVSAKVKRAIYVRDGVPYPPPRDQPDEVDHDISICLSGAETSDQAKPGFGRNLWCEPRYGPWNAYWKDGLEVKLHTLNKAGKLTIAQVADDIRGYHWVWSYLHFVGPAPA